MRSLIIAGTALALTGCATGALQEYAEAANTLDPGCAKKVHVEVTPMLVFGWPVPLFSGTLDKECRHAPSDQSVGIVQPGQVLATQ